jgi:hypothetical protein
MRRLISFSLGVKSGWRPVFEMWGSGPQRLVYHLRQQDLRESNNATVVRKAVMSTGGFVVTKV